ncbi:MAG: class I mannose-6-phosphate isomerase [Paludibacter sp.]|nr:class I mannose-6-phosphate isomerase [Paludibacter sp.]
MLYPLKFQPILKDKIWGGSKLKNIFQKSGSTDKSGESWELSGYAGDESVVINGFLADNTLTELIEIYMGDLVGDAIYEQYGWSFPLLFKLIDANDNLSIQVHPGDEIAAERHNSFGKTEMWYVVDADAGSELTIGFTNDCSPDEYLDALENDKVESLLQKVPVTKGDVLFIPAGLVHAIGKGIVVAEIQQSSDVTYRIYDYKRVDENGNERDLHTDEALDVINFNAAVQPKIHYTNALNKIVPLVQCDYFTTNLICFDQAINRTYGTIDSFKTYLCIEGNCFIEYNNEKTIVYKGDTILIPACIDEIGLLPEGEVTLLEVFAGNIE